MFSRREETHCRKAAVFFLLLCMRLKRIWMSWMRWKWEA